MALRLSRTPAGAVSLFYYFSLLHFPFHIFFARDLFHTPRVSKNEKISLKKSKQMLKFYYSLNKFQKKICMQLTLIDDLKQKQAQIHSSSAVSRVDYKVKTGPMQNINLLIIIAIFFLPFHTFSSITRIRKSTFSILSVKFWFWKFAGLKE